jgi:hypothetical protein
MLASGESGFFIKMNGIRQLPKRNGFRLNKIFFDALYVDGGFISIIGKGLQRFTADNNLYVF